MAPDWGDGQVNCLRVRAMSSASISAESLPENELFFCWPPQGIEAASLGK